MEERAALTPLQAAIVANLRTAAVAPTRRERLALASRTEEFADDLDMAPLVNDFGVVGKRRTPALTLWPLDAAARQSAAVRVALLRVHCGSSWARRRRA